MTDVVPRPLDDRERAMIVAMVERGATFDDDVVVTPADRARWLAQVPGTWAGRPCGCGTCPSVELTDADGVTPAGERTRVVLEGGTTGALVLLFVDDDRLSYLELAPTDDTSFSRFPPVSDLVTG